MPELLIELFSEEIPSNLQINARRQLEKLLSTNLISLNLNYKNLKVTNWGTIKVDHKTMMTSDKGVFAAGDIVRGASLVVWAIKDGRDAADSIHKYLLNKNKINLEKKVSVF